MSSHHPHERQEHERTVPARRHAQPEHAAYDDHAHAADNRQATQQGSRSVADVHREYAAHRAAQRAAAGEPDSAHAVAPNVSAQIQHELGSQIPPSSLDQVAHHAPMADNRHAPQTGSQRTAMFQQHYAAHRAAQQAAADGLHLAANAPSPSARQVAQDLARQTPDYVGAIQTMDKDPDAHERQRLAATITSHLDAHLSAPSMYEMLRTLQPLKTHGYLARFEAALEQGASGVAKDRLAFALAVIDTGTGALDDTESHHYLADRKPDRYNDKAGYYDDYEGAVTYLKGVKGVDMNGYGLVPVSTDLASLIGTLEGKLQEVNDLFSSTAHGAVRDAIASIGDAPVDYTAWWATIAGTIIAAGACLVPGVGPVATLGFATLGAAVTAAGSVPNSQQSFRDRMEADIGDPQHKSINTIYGHIDHHIGPLAQQIAGDAQKNKWTTHRAELVILQTFFGSEVIKMAGGGRPSLDTDAMTARITRDLMLSVVKVAGQVVYEYRATNAIHSYNEGAASFTLNPPDLWTYTPDKTVLRVPSQIVTPLSNVLDHGGVIGADLQIPKAIMVSAPDDVGTTGTLWFFVGDKGEVEASSFPTGVPIFNPLSQSTFIESREEFGGQIREHVWGTKPGTPPRTWVGGNDVIGY